MQKVAQPNIESARWPRWMLAGPGAILASLMTMLGMALWLPAGAGGANNLVLPLILLPLIWTAFFLHACLDQRLARVAAVLLVASAANGMLIGNQFVTTPVEGAHP